MQVLQVLYSWGIKGFNKSHFYGVKLPWLWAVSASQEWIFSIEKWVHFFLDPWLLVCQFVKISNQMESNCKASNFENKNLFNSLLVIRGVLLLRSYGPYKGFCIVLYKFCFIKCLQNGINWFFSIKFYTRIVKGKQFL